MHCPEPLAVVRSMGRDELEGAFLQAGAVLAATGEELAALRSSLSRIKAQRDRLVNAGRYIAGLHINFRGERELREAIADCEQNP
jgi:hypothetical protein